MPFWAGRVQDAIDEKPVAGGVLDAKDVGGDLDEERLEFTFVPGAEHVGQLRRRETGGVEYGVGLGDQLHVAVFDAVVDHLDVVSGTGGSAIGGAGAVVGHGGNAFQDRPHGFIGGGGTARHDRRAEQGAGFAAADPGPEEHHVGSANALEATGGVLEVRVAAVHDYVARRKQREQLVQHGVHAAAGLHHQDDAARALQRRNECFERAGATDGRARRFVNQEFVGALDGAVEDRNGKAVTLDVEREIAAHDRESDESDGGGRHGRLRE